jgi:hypothetical protein
MKDAKNTRGVTAKRFITKLLAQAHSFVFMCKLALRKYAVKRFPPRKTGYAISQQERGFMGRVFAWQQ